MLEQHDKSVQNHWTSNNGDYPAKKNAKYYSIHFSSKEDYLDYLETTVPEYIGSSDRPARTGWVTTDSLGEALKWAREGNSELRDRYLDAVKDLDTHVKKTENATKRKSYGVAGAYPDIPLYVSGQLCHMVIPKSIDGKPIIRIAVPINASNRISEETMFNYGASMLRLIDQIEQGGLAQVELTAIKFNFDCWGGSKQWGCSYPLKKAGEPVSIDDLAFHICSSSSLRRCMFRIGETISCTKSAKSIDIGAGRNCTSTDILEYDNFGNTQDLVLPIIERNMTAPECWNYVKAAVVDNPAIDVEFG